MPIKIIVTSQEIAKPLLEQNHWTRRINNKENKISEKITVGLNPTNS
jgi:hypothetical protein